MLNTHFTDEVPNESQRAQLCSAFHLAQDPNALNRDFYFFLHKGENKPKKLKPLLKISSKLTSFYTGEVTTRGTMAEN